MFSSRTINYNFLLFPVILHIMIWTQSIQTQFSQTLFQLSYLEKNIQLISITCLMCFQGGENSNDRRRQADTELDTAPIERSSSVDPSLKVEPSEDSEFKVRVTVSKRNTAQIHVLTYRRLGAKGSYLPL